MKKTDKQILTHLNSIEAILENALSELRILKKDYTPSVTTNIDRSKILIASSEAVRKRREFERKKVASNAVSALNK